MASASQKGPMAFFSWNTAFGECLQRAHSSRRLPMQVEPICPIDIQSPKAARRRASVGQATFLMFTLLRLSTRYQAAFSTLLYGRNHDIIPWPSARPADRKSGVSGKRVSVRVDLGGRRIHKK